MAKKRNGRQDAIRDIVRNKDVRTQRVLVDELRAMGFDCTQATVSRDIADMGLRKLPEGIYVLAEDLHLQRMVSELVTGVLRTDNLVMIAARYGFWYCRSCRCCGAARRAWLACRQRHNLGHCADGRGRRAS